MKKVFKFLGNVVLCVVASVFLLTCNDNVGLGTAVDVQKPSLEIEYPPLGAVIRDSFVLAGTCSDDYGVEKVIVTIVPVSEDGSGDLKAITRAAQLNEDKTKWTVTLNEGTPNNDAKPPLVPEKKFELIDGKYTFMVQAFDGANRYNDPVSRTFEIDNTAPVLILNKPLAVADENPSSYGRLLKLAGDTSDDHSFKLSFYAQEVEKPAYDLSGAPVTFKGDVISMENLNVSSMSSDSPLLLAKYYDNPSIGDESKLSTAYTNIYGDVAAKNQNKYFYTGIRLADIAKKYQDPESGAATDETGNITSCYFLNTQNLGSVLDNLTAEGIKASDIKKMLNGNDSDNPNKKHVIDALETIGNYVDCDSSTDIKATSNVFSLNPDNNPTWSISSYELNGKYKEDSSPFRACAEKSSLMLVVAPNKDADFIEPTQIALYYQRVQPCAGKGKVGSVEIDGWETMTGVSPVCLIAKGQWTEESTKDTIQYPFEIPEGLNGGEKYVFYIEGKDRAGNDYVSAMDDGYGFVVSTNKIAPIVSIVSINGSTNKDEKFFKFDDLNKSGIKGGLVIEGTINEQSKDLCDDDGTVVVDGETKKPFDCKILVTDSYGNTVNLSTPTIVYTQRMQGGEKTSMWDWSVTFSETDMSKYAQDNYTMNFTFEATNKVPLAGYAQLTLVGDNAPPKLEITNKDLIVNERSTSITGEGPYTFTLRGKWSDVGGSSTKALKYSTNSTTKASGTWKTVGADGTGDAPTVTTESSWSQAFTVTESEGNTFAVYAIDEMGNETDVVKYDNVKFDFAVPTVVPSPYDKVTNSTTNYVIDGTVKDSYKLDATQPVTLDVYKKNGDEFVKITTDYDLTVGTGDKSVPWTLTLDTSKGLTTDGVYKIAVTAKDSVGRVSTTWNSEEITVDTIAPTMNGSAKFGGFAAGTDKWYNETAISVTGELIEAGTDIKTVYYWLTKNSSDAVIGNIDEAKTFSAAKNNTGYYAFNTTVAGFASGDNYFTFIAEDGAGNRSNRIGPYLVKLDRSMPNIELEKVNDVSTDAATQLTNGKANMTFSGTVNDDASGVSKLELKLGNKIISSEDASNTAGSITLGTQTEVGTGEDKKLVRTWNATINAATLKDLGNNTVTLYANVFDVSGNENESIRLCNIASDTTPPSTKIDNPKYRFNGQTTTTVNKVVVLSGTSSDNQTIKDAKLQYKIGSSGTYTDFAGGITEVGGQKVWSETATGGISFVTEGGNSIAWSVQLDTTKAFGSVADGTVVYVRAITNDQAGNANEDTAQGTGEISFTVDQKTDRPILKISTIKSANGFVNTEVIQGNLTDDDSDSSATVQKLVVSTTPIASFSSASTDSGGTTDLNPDGTWSFTLTDASDGAKALYFYIIDKEDAVFAANTGDRIYVKYYNGDQSELTGSVAFTLDKEVPVVDSAYVIFGSTAASVANNVTLTANNSSALSDSSTVYLGGTSRSNANLKISAHDANGIAALNATIDGVDYSIEKGVAGGTGTLETVNATTVNWYLPLTSLVSSTSKLADGSYMINVTATDSSGSKSAVKQYQISIDNTAPTAKLTSPTATVVTNATLTAEFADTGSNLAKLPGGNEIVQKWVIPTNQEQVADSVADTRWQTITGGTSSFTKNLYWKDISTYTNTDNTGYASVTGNIATVPVWFKTVDALGNSTTVKTTFKVDMDSSLASTTISSPSNLSKVGATSVITGNATVSGAAISEVRLQFDANGDKVYDLADFRIISGTATATDISDAKNLADSNKKWKKWSAIKPTGKTTPRLVAKDASGNNLITVTQDANGDDIVSVTAGTVAEWYIVANNTDNWKLPVDMSMFNYSYKGGSSGENPQIEMRAKAYATAANDAGVPVEMKNYDASGVETGEHIRDWAVASATDESTGVAKCTVTVDTGVPLIEDIYFVQYSAGSSGDITISRSYSQGMFISPNVGNGQWYLTAKISDETAIDSYSIKNVGGTGYLIWNGDNDIEVTEISETSDVKEINLGIGSERKVALTTKSTATGQFYLVFTATDKTGKSYQQYLDFNVDSEAPTIPKVSGNAVLTNASGNTLGDAYNVEQSDGNFMLQGSMTDAGNSGLKYVAFWFERQPKAGSSRNFNRVLNPMFAYGDTYENETRIDGTNLVELTDDGIAALHLTVTRPDDKTITLTTANKNIRRGGLVKIGGSYVMISDIDSTGTTLTLNESVAEDFIDAYFAFAQVVNGRGKEEGESASSDYDSFDLNNTPTDGDGMREGFLNDGKWWAEIPSNNLLDGPVIIHVTAIDGAGNISNAKLTTKVANNRPRIVKVMVGSDWNGNGTFDVGENKDGQTVGQIVNVAGNSLAQSSGTVYGEFTYYSTIEQGDKYRDQSIGKSVVTLQAADGKNFVVPNNLCVIPEFTGGNGVLKYAMNISDSEVTSGIASATPIALSSTNAELKLTGSYETLLQTAAVGANKKYGGIVINNDTTIASKTLTAWDTKILSTDSLTPEYYLAFTFWDETAETTQGQDSLFALLNVPVILKLKDTEVPQVKIKPFYWTDSEDNSVYQGDEIGIKGHIELEGDLSTALTTGYTAGAPKVSGQIILRGTVKDDIRIKNISVSMDGLFSGKVLDYDKATGTWTADATNVNNGATPKVMAASAEDVYADQSGHSVEYTIVLNTAQMTDVAGLNKKIRVFANDGTNNSKAENFTGTQTTASAETDYYVVDVVPYITDIERQGANGGTTHRSQWGRFAVKEGETIKVSGYNLANATVNPEVKVGNTKVTPANKALAKDGLSTFNITVPANSGELTLTTSLRPSINSLNNDANVYNIEDNDEHEGMADTRYLYVWNIDHKFAGVPDTATNVVMSVNKTGRPYAQYVRSGDGQIMFMESLTGTPKQIYRCYDQPNVKTALAVDTKSTGTGNAAAGGASVLFFGENVGNSGTIDSNGSSMGDVGVTGGADAIIMTSAQVANNVSFGADKDIEISGNPHLRLDSNVVSSFYPLMSYNMKREMNLFDTPRTAKYGITMHNIWYDKHTKSLKYSYVDSNSTTYNTMSNGSTAGWVLIDGGYNGQDRLHNNTTQNHTQGQYVLYHFNNNMCRVATTHENNNNTPAGSTKGAAYADDILAIGTNAYTGVTTGILTNKSATSCKITVSNRNYWNSRLVTGATIAFMVDGTNRTIALSTIKGVSWDNNNSTSCTLTYDNCPDAVNAATVTIYCGNYNVVGLAGSIAESVTDRPSNSAGKYSAIDVTSTGVPVIAYFDTGNNTVKVAVADKANPTLAADWKRVATGAKGGTHVSMCIDGANIVHIMYRDSSGKLQYIKSTTAASQTMTFSKPILIDNSGSLTYGTISVIKDGTKYIPCATYLNNEETADGIKYAVCDVDNNKWDSVVVPATTRYAVGENMVQIAGNGSGGGTAWSDTQGGVSLANCQAQIGYQSEGMEIVYLKKE